MGEAGAVRSVSRLLSVVRAEGDPLSAAGRPVARLPSAAGRARAAVRPEAGQLAAVARRPAAAARAGAARAGRRQAAAVAAVAAARSHWPAAREPSGRCRSRRSRRWQTRAGRRCRRPRRTPASAASSARARRPRPGSRTRAAAAPEAPGWAAPGSVVAGSDRSRARARPPLRALRGGGRSPEQARSCSSPARPVPSWQDEAPEARHPRHAAPPVGAA